MNVCAPIPPVRLPSLEWVAFLSGPLSADDWKLIDRVECGELSVDAAMANRNIGGCDE